MIADRRPNPHQTIEADPVLSFQYIWNDLAIAKPTFFRSIRPTLPIVEISERRRGVRLSDYLKWKAARVRAPQRAA